MALAPGTHLGPYEIESQLGAGGMGEVYRAKDTRLDRTVAIKVSSAKFSDRFEREARSIAALNHPNICTLYDVGPNYLVMEYLEGETLDARIQKGALPVREALHFAAQILAALDAAHRRGIVHRDLKPANVMIGKTGLKLLDFGLAKAQTAAAEPEGATLGITADNTIVGTLQYMSPEQLEGKTADACSDIFAFGVVLYEMLTGRKAFAGASQASLITAIMSSDPTPLTAAEATNAPALDRLVKRCLAKSPDDRWRCAHDLRAEIEWIAAGGAPPQAITTATRKPALLPWILAASLAAATGWLAIVHLGETPEPRIPARFSISVPEGRVFAWYDGPVISPDGERFVIAASEPGGPPMLFLRSLRSTAVQPIPGTEGAYFPFWSPDSKQVGFFSLSDGKLKRVDLAGGAPQVLCGLRNPGDGRGGTWLQDRSIVFGRAQGSLLQVSVEGGEPKELIPMSAWEHEHHRPQILPGGELLFYADTSKPELSGTYVLDLRSKQRKRIFEGSGQYVSGFLLFVRDGMLAARKVDLKNAALTGETLQIARPVYSSPVSASLAGSFSTSPAGVLCLRTGTGSEDSQFIVLSRDGKTLKVLGERGLYTNPALSPDGKMLAYGKTDLKLKTRDLWVLDLQRNTPTRLTSDPADDLNPVWSPDGRWIYFTSERNGSRQLYRKPSSGVGAEELLFASEDRKNVEDITPDGRTLIFNLQAKGKPEKVNALRIEDPTRPVAVIESQFGDDQAQISPNGRWIAYRSAESGRQEVYVQTFSLDPKQPRGKWRISTSGGVEPRWRPDGKELFYVERSVLFAVEVKTDGPTFEAGVPKRLFPAALGPINRNRFVISKSGDILVNAVQDEAATAPIEVITNWSPVRR
jgi:Tol biopolymer transport system component/predicted Ser/Thr protein kinase